jgi:hypothetical protein
MHRLSSTGRASQNPIGDASVGTGSDDFDDEHAGRTTSSGPGQPVPSGAGLARRAVDFVFDQVAFVQSRRPGTFSIVH